MKKRSYHQRPSRQLDLLGKKFDKLTVVEKTDLRDHGYVLWRTRCDCGNERLVRTNLLTDPRPSIKACEECIENKVVGTTRGNFTCRENHGEILECECNCGSSDCMGEITLTRSQFYALSLIGINKRCWNMHMIGKWSAGSVIRYELGKNLRPVEKIRKDPECLLLLQVKCAYCNQWFRPTYNQYRCRQLVLDGIADHDGECRFYCSEGCKLSCPIYGRTDTPRGVAAVTETKLFPILKGFEVPESFLTGFKEDVFYRDFLIAFKYYFGYASINELCKEFDLVHMYVQKIIATHLGSTIKKKITRKKWYMVEREVPTGELMQLYEVNTSREVQPQLRQMVLERDNWTCQKCEAGVDAELHCHHLEGIRWNPLESADIDMCITYCKACHREAHSHEGCKTSDMRCNEVRLSA